ncbi:class I SAM-dependent methyltransferase [Cellvibrio sp. KB43]|uniref:Class I SAM-dependent methyltransferase n=2 Tax=Cellvibrio polysaccharolyticus TaxID=2082724 RepID=A0A928V850_9GAMM|nr:class I SAM-dependent methyltransferase [Cellvibrio polysaccharolyticus]
MFELNPFTRAAGMAMNDELKHLQEEAFKLCNSAHFQQVVMDHCNLEKSAFVRQPDITIHPRDQMLLHSLFHHQDANVGFSQYYNVALQQFYAANQMVQRMFPHTEKGDLKILDFACGFGRLLRFLTAAYPAGCITGSEIQTDALEFVGSTYNIPTVPSCANPEDFNPQEKFHVIWVASLFSHLPSGLFHQWLKKLHSCLTPDGVLCFSVHDACLLPEGHVFPEDEGIFFWPGSENEDLETSIYGTTYVNEAFVSQAVTITTGRASNYHRLPRALAHEQDIYIVAANPDTDLTPLAGFRRGAWGWADERYLADNGELYLRGWAASVDDGRLDHVDIQVDDQHFRVPTGTGISREDVGLFFNDDRLNNSGWEFRYTIPAGIGPVRVTASARTSIGEKALLFTGEFPRPASVTRPIETTPPAACNTFWNKMCSFFRKP